MDADERDHHPERKVERLQRRFVGVTHDSDLDGEPDDQGLAGRAGEKRRQAMAPPGQDRGGQWPEPNDDEQDRARYGIVSEGRAGERGHRERKDLATGSEKQRRSAAESPNGQEDLESDGNPGRARERFSRVMDNRRHSFAAAPCWKAAAVARTPSA